MKLLFIITIFFVCSSQISGQNMTIGIGGDFTNLEAAESQMDPGDTVFILNGTYTLGPQFLTVSGTENNPIVIQAMVPHAVILEGGSEAIHLVDCSHMVLSGLIIQGQTGNGINIDDGGNYSTPTHHITIRDCIFRDMNASGNNDLLKLSGLDDFLIEYCQFINGGDGGSGIDMVGCHNGIIQDNFFDDSGSSGIQAKGGTQHILIQRNIFKDINQRALNLGGSTGLEFFRPPLPNPIVNAFEAADLEVYSNVFIRSWSLLAYVGCVRVKVYNNTIYDPENWVIRILQETTEPGFLPCANNEFRNNLVYVTQDLTEVNIGPDTDSGSFIFTNNLWWNEADGNWSPVLPVIDSNQIIADPLLSNVAEEDFSIPSNSPCVGNGKYLPVPKIDFVQNFYAEPPSIGAFEGDSIITSVPYVITANDITMFPNPSANSITITGDFADSEIELLNGSGAILKNYPGFVPPLIIQLEGLNTGIYFLRIKSKTNPSLQVTRLIIKN